MSGLPRREGAHTLLWRRRLEGGTGQGVSLRAGQHLRVINVHGTQVVDTWAFSLADPLEHLSMAHSREVLQRLVFEPGDAVLSNRYTPMLDFVADDSPGGHDTLIAACNPLMYRRAGAAPGHPSCAGNLAAVLAGRGVTLPWTPQPWNLFMQAPVPDGRRIVYTRPRAGAGDAVELRALMDCLAVFSACPDDVYPTNGGDGSAREVLLELWDPAG